jgi:hypothetical protein
MRFAPLIGATYLLADNFSCLFIDNIELLHLLAANATNICHTCVTKKPHSISISIMQATITYRALNLFIRALPRPTCHRGRFLWPVHRPVWRHLYYARTRGIGSWCRRVRLLPSYYTLHTPPPYNHRSMAIPAPTPTFMYDKIAPGSCKKIDVEVRTLPHLVASYLVVVSFHPD